MMTVTQGPDAHANVIELFFTALKQFITGQLVNDVSQVLAGMGALGQP